MHEPLILNEYFQTIDALNWLISKYASFNEIRYG